MSKICPSVNLPLWTWQSTRISLTFPLSTCIPVYWDLCLYRSFPPLMGKTGQALRNMVPPRPENLAPTIKIMEQCKNRVTERKQHLFDDSTSQANPLPSSENSLS